MPEKLRKFLESLKDIEREEVWEYLDSNPDAVHEMIEIVGDEE